MKPHLLLGLTSTFFGVVLLAVSLYLLGEPTVDWSNLQKRTIATIALLSGGILIFKVGFQAFSRKERIADKANLEEKTPLHNLQQAQEG